MGTIEQGENQRKGYDLFAFEISCYSYLEELEFERIRISKLKEKSEMTVYDNVLQIVDRLNLFRIFEYFDKSKEQKELLDQQAKYIK